jgi:hypothetical protein
MADIVERYSTTINIYSEKKVTPKLSAAYLLFKIILLIANLIFMVNDERAEQPQSLAISPRRAGASQKHSCI